MRLRRERLASSSLSNTWAKERGVPPQSRGARPSRGRVCRPGRGQSGQQSSSSCGHGFRKSCQLPPVHPAPRCGAHMRVLTALVLTANLGDRTRPCPHVTDECGRAQKRQGPTARRWQSCIWSLGLTPKGSALSTTTSSGLFL